ncbi:hypothetical protein EDB86DRAFT_2230800 [Lactarius hatsudake]|nr:hypothetical protein EDB86DRAFT_2230800 [Lactarius hatsudake]
MRKDAQTNMGCDELIETTAAALNDNIVASMLSAVQRDQLKLSVQKCSNSFVSRYSARRGAGFNVTQIVQECLVPLPYIWVSVDRVSTCRTRLLMPRLPVCECLPSLHGLYTDSMADAAAHPFVLTCTVLHHRVLFFWIHVYSGMRNKVTDHSSETYYSYETRVVYPRVVSKPKLGHCRVPSHLFHLAFHLVSKNNVAFSCCSPYTIPSPLLQPS